jgi:hypothetical protein
MKKGRPISPGARSIRYLLLGQALLGKKPRGMAFFLVENGNEEARAGGMADQALGAQCRPLQHALKAGSWSCVSAIIDSHNASISLSI